MAEETKKPEDKPAKKEGLDVSKVTEVSKLEGMLSHLGHSITPDTRTSIFNRIISILETGDDYGFLARGSANSAKRWLPPASEMRMKVDMAIETAKKR